MIKRVIPATTFEGLDLLLKKRSGPCLSMLLPFNRKQSLKKQNINILKGALAKASLLLECYECSREQKDKVKSELQKLALSLDPLKCNQPMGVFIANDIVRLIFFPFEIEEMVLVADSFEIRDVLYLRQYLSPYYLLFIGGNTIRLFLAEATLLQEVRDDLFPLKYGTRRKGQRIDPGFAIKDFGKDKTSLLDARINQFLDQSSHHFSRYLSGHIQTVIVAGTAPVVAQLKNAFAKRKMHVGVVPGTFRDGDLLKLRKRAWDVCRMMREEEMRHLIERLGDQPLRNKVKGLRKVWEAATAGKGLLLPVERDFRQAAYIPKGGEQIRLHPPKGAYTYVADAVDDAIEKVLRAHGQVFMTAPRELGKFENIGMMLRY